MFAIILLVMMSLLFVLFITVPLGVFLGYILYVPGSGLRTLETGVGTLVSVSVTVVDARTIPWSGRTTPGSLSVCHTPGSVPASTFIREPFEKVLIV